MFIKILILVLLNCNYVLCQNISLAGDSTTCPQSFEQFDKFCYIFTQRSSFLPKCPFVNNLPFEYYDKLPWEMRTGSVWVPVQADSEDKQFRWKEPSLKYLDIFYSFYYQNDIKNENCLIRTTDNYTAVSCEEMYPAVCIYYKSDQWNRTYEKDLTPNLHLDLEYDRFVLNVSYPFLFRRSGWNMSVKCFPNNWFPFVNLTQIESSSGNISLFMSESLSGFSGYIRCDGFTNTNLNISSNQIYFEEGSFVAQFMKKENATPNYVTETSSTTTYATFQKLSIKQSNYTLNPWRNYTRPPRLDPITSSIMKLLSSSISGYCFKVTDLHKEISTTKYVTNISFRCFTNFSRNGGDKYNHLKKLINESFVNEKEVEFLHLQKQNYCPPVVENGLTWPETSKGLETYSSEFCFTADGNRLKRKCLSNSKWKLIDKKCEIQNRSLITNFLTGLEEKENSLTVLYQLRDISNNYKEMNALDVYLIFTILQNVKLKLDYTPWLKSVYADIIENVFKIDNVVLMESRLKMHEKDSSLDICHDYKLTPTVRTNFKCELGASPTHSIIKGDTTKVLIPNSLTLNIDTTDEHILKQIVKFLKFNDDIILWILQPSSIMQNTSFSTYQSDGFFADNVTLLANNASTIFSARLNRENEQEFQIPEEPQILVIRKISDKVLVKYPNCLLSKHNKPWEIVGPAKNFRSSLYCEFQYLGYYALIYTPLEITNTTEILNEILESNDNSSESLQKLRRVSFNHEKFTPDDVSLVSKFLQKIDKNKNINVETIGDIINNVLKIDKKTLCESQMDASATDQILYYTDLIVQNQEYGSEFQSKTENFMTFVYDVRKTNFFGLVLFENNTVQILNSFVNATDLLEFVNLQSAMVLSPQLAKQIQQDSKVYINVFLKDTLFVEKNAQKRKEVSKIFDVFFRNFSRNFSRPVSVFHKTDSPSMCSYWSYNVPQNISGFWKIDSKSSKFSSLVQCDFWHTTHLALLFLSEDNYAHTTLDLITYVGSSFSIFGYIAIFLTACFFKRWRSEIGIKILLNFALASLLVFLGFFISSTVKDHYNQGDRYEEENPGINLCLLTGLFLHYSVLAQFSWMLVVAILQYKRYVKVFNTYDITHLLLKTCLFAWGLPILPTVILVGVDYKSYVSGVTGLCYPSGSGLYVGVYLYIFIVLLINAWLYVYIIGSIYKQTESIQKTSKLGVNELLYKWKLLLLLFFMLGLTWVLPIFAELGSGSLFVYLFCILGSLQGFIIFFFFVVLNKDVRNLYSMNIKKLKY